MSHPSAATCFHIVIDCLITALVGRLYRNNNNKKKVAISSQKQNLYFLHVAPFHVLVSAARSSSLAVSQLSFVQATN